MKSWEDDGLAGKDLRLEVDEDLCTACGLCEERAPENLAVDYDDHLAAVVKQPVGEVEAENCTEAVDYCPTGGLAATMIDAKEEAA